MPRRLISKITIKIDKLYKIKKYPNKFTRTDPENHCCRYGIQKKEGNIEEGESTEGIIICKKVENWDRLKLIKIQAATSGGPLRNATTKDLDGGDVSYLNYLRVYIYIYISTNRLYVKTLCTAFVWC